MSMVFENKERQTYIIQNVLYGGCDQTVSTGSVLSC